MRRPGLAPFGLKPSGTRVLRGIVLLARFRPDGLDHFDGGVQHVLSSLAPLLAFPLLFLFLVMLSGGTASGLAELLSVIDALLMQIVLSEALARFWGREAEWGRYAVAFNWCQWAVPLVGLLLLVAVPILVVAGLPQVMAAPLALLALAGYALALQWFVARHALRISALRAAVLVLGVNVGTAAVVIVPTQLRLLLDGAA